MRVGAPYAAPRPVVVRAAAVVRADLAAIPRTEHDIKVGCRDFLYPLDKWMWWYPIHIRAKILGIFAKILAFRPPVIDSPRIHEDPRSHILALRAVPLDMAQDGVVGGVGSDEEA